MFLKIKSYAFRVSKLYAYWQSLTLWFDELVGAQLVGATSEARNFYTLVSSHLLLLFFSLCNHILSGLFTKGLRGRCALEK